jgi:hypothetical protein
MVAACFVTFRLVYAFIVLSDFVTKNRFDVGEHFLAERAKRKTSLSVLIIKPFFIYFYACQSKQYINRFFTVSIYKPSDLKPLCVMCFHDRSCLRTQAIAGTLARLGSGAGMKPKTVLTLFVDGVVRSRRRLTRHNSN